MKHLLFADEMTDCKYLILVPELKKDAIERAYITPYGLDPAQVVAVDLHKTGKKTPVKIMKEYVKELEEVIHDLKPEYVIVGDADYYKVISKQRSAETSLGYVQPLDDLNTHVIYVPNYRQIFYDPDTVNAKIALSMKAMHSYGSGSYAAPGDGIIHGAHYPKTTVEVLLALEKLLNLGQDITCDIETFSLKHYDAGIGTISFATDQNHGAAFQVDVYPANYLIEPEEHKRLVRKALKDFFIAFPNKIIFHNASFDVSVLIYQLFMDHIEDTAGLLYGLEVFMSKIEDTKIIAYLATNTCAGNTLGLKPLSHEFSGNYSVDDITDITAIPVDELLQYNLIDCLSTWYVYDKYYPIMVEDNQEEIYRTLFRPALADIIQMQLTGMPVDPKKVQQAKKTMQADMDKAYAALEAQPVVQAFVHQMKEDWVNEKNATLKKKRVTFADAPYMRFNPNSDVQLQKLLFEVIGLPVLARTAKKQPSTKGKVIKNLINHTDDQDVKDLIAALIDFKDVIIILTTFITAFEKAIEGPSGQFYLFGNFNLGGTVSGRLSSNNPNMQNIPSSGTKYAKIIKQCFVAQHPWLFMGLDFASLEDRISALTTKDPNKLKVYTDGYDGHCLRAYFYFGEYMPDITSMEVNAINSIKVKYEGFRQESKTPTFLLTYGGTYIGIMDQMGWTQSKAQHIESKYHEMYAHSDKWIQDKLNKAGHDGYITAAFGLRVRTPLLKQVIRGTRVTPYEAEAEGRTAGNALGQSWGLLNSRAHMAFMQKVRDSKYRLDIRHCAQIHDAGYYLVRNDPEVILWFNENLVKEVQWQEHPDIWHDEVKLGGESTIFFPTWAEELTLPNELDYQLLLELTEKHVDKLNNPEKYKKK